MNLRTVIEFGPYGWHPHYRNIKKLLRQNGIPFKTKTRATEKGIFQSIWVFEEHFEKARELTSSYDFKDAYTIAQEGRVKKLSKDIEKNWYRYLVQIIIFYSFAHPWKFLAALFFIFAIILLPFYQYG